MSTYWLLYTKQIYFTSKILWMTLKGKEVVTEYYLFPQEH